jgi:hypothetical protein
MGKEAWAMEGGEENARERGREEVESGMSRAQGRGASNTPSHAGTAPQLTPGPAHDTVTPPSAIGWAYAYNSEWR